MAKIYRWHVVDENGNHIESNLPSEDIAVTMMNYHMQNQSSPLRIISEHVPQLTSILGRDPDLH
jgi:hypothetical protein